MTYFSAFDEAKARQIANLNRKLVELKAKLKRLGNQKAGEHFAQSEYENLFLDCVDQCKKDAV